MTWMVRGKLRKEQTRSVIQDRSEFTVLIESVYSKCAARRQMLLRVRYWLVSVMTVGKSSLGNNWTSPNEVWTPGRVFFLWIGLENLVVNDLMWWFLSECHNFTKPKVTSWVVFSPKQENVLLPREIQQILTFEKLQPKKNWQFYSD